MAFLILIINLRNKSPSPRELRAASETFPAKEHKRAFHAGCRIIYLPPLGGCVAGWGGRRRRGSKPLESLCVCGSPHAANSWANHGESEEMREPSAFCSFFPLWPPQTQARLLFRSLPAQLRPLGLQRPPLGPSQEFPPSSGDGLRTHFQPKMDLSPQEEQLWGPDTGTLQIF